MAIVQLSMQQKATYGRRCGLLTSSEPPLDLAQIAQGGLSKIGDDYQFEATWMLEHSASR